jgi:hypothetical protein
MLLIFVEPPKKICTKNIPNIRGKVKGERLKEQRRATYPLPLLVREKVKG